MLFDPKWNTEPKVVDAVGKCLLRAGDYMNWSDWCQGQYYDDDGRVCPLRAISLVAETIEQRMEANMRLGEYLGWPVDRWNDTICQTQEQAVEACRAAAYHR